MRVIPWTIISSLMILGFVSLVVAAEEGTTSDPDNNPTAAMDPDAGIEADGGVEDDAGGPEETEVEAAPPPPPPPQPVVDESTLPDAEPLEHLPFSKGSMEVALGVSLSGNGTENYLGVAGRFAYYLMDRIAPGIDVQYTHVFVDDSVNRDYPEVMTFLPFLKFVLTRKSVAPYVLALGGYAAEWSSKNAVNSWILGLGAGVHITVAKRVRINIELTAQHHWYSDKKIYWYKDDTLLHRQDDKGRKVHKSDCEASGDCFRQDNPAEQEGRYVLVDSDKNTYVCEDEALCEDNTFKDKKDVDREWFFPLISVGIGFVF